MKPVRIVIFAKAPRPGFAKTRLIPALGAQGSALLAQRMLVHTVREALRAELGPVELCVTPSAADPSWQAVAIPEGVGWSDQGEGDLGKRMARAARRVIDGGNRVLLIGTDCPELDAARLRQAAAALQRMEVTLFPTFDGGYALLGLNRFHAALFTGIAWSTGSVASATLRHVEQLGWTVQSHPLLHDIDEPADLQWLPQAWRDRAQERV